MKGVTILGSTGSIGVNTLDVIARHPDLYKVDALTANTQVERLYDQCLRFNPRYAVMLAEQSAEQLREKLNKTECTTTVLQGEASLAEVAAHADTDTVMAAIVGAAGLLPTLAAVKQGKKVLLANKEALVMSGHIFMQAVQDYGAELLPIDSEHNAVFQCMPSRYAQGLEKSGIKKILLTASGGPFRGTPLDLLEGMTPAQACAHPNWDMGRKISVDSATMMNKGLEVIEACWLFAAALEQVQVVMHPQSIVHSMVEYVDGSILAQLGQPDMRTPIAHALAWPERIHSGVASLNLFELDKLEFKQPDLQRFPCLKMAYDAMRAGGTQTTILNAANEIAVAAFLDNKIKFTDIALVIEKVLSELSYRDATSLEIILEDDKHARLFTQELLAASMSAHNKAGS